MSGIDEQEDDLRSRRGVFTRIFDPSFTVSIMFGVLDETLIGKEYLNGITFFYFVVSK